MALESSELSFDVSHESDPSEVVVAGFAQFGLAGLTAVDYLREQLDLAERGHVDARGLPSITPFEAGTPRHHTRLFSTGDVPLTALVGELFVPVSAAAPFSDAVLDWIESTAVEEVVILSGIPIQHGPDAHRTFYVATEDFREYRLADGSVEPMGTGFLDGVNGTIVERGMNSDLRVGVFVTPVHGMAPDVEAAIRLLETVGSLYDVDFDMGPLREFADEVASFYAGLHERMTEIESEGGRQMPEDRMFM